MLIFGLDLGGYLFLTDLGKRLSSTENVQVRKELFVRIIPRFNQDKRRKTLKINLNQGDSAETDFPNIPKLRQALTYEIVNPVAQNMDFFDLDKIKDLVQS